MWPRASAGVVVVLVTLLFASAAAGQGSGKLNMYILKGPAETISQAAPGVELIDVRQTGSGIKADAVLTSAERAKLSAADVKVKVLRNKRGRSVRAQAARQAAGGFNVWRSWDEPGGIRDELYRVARRNPQLVKLEVIGHTHEGRELIALKLTKGARGERDGKRPAVLYSSNQHAREWISLEVNRRLLHYFIDAGGRMTRRSGSC